MVAISLKLVASCDRRPQASVEKPSLAPWGPISHPIVVYQLDGIHFQFQLDLCNSDSKLAAKPCALFVHKLEPALVVHCAVRCESLSPPISVRGCPTSSTTCADMLCSVHLKGMRR